ncbi:cytochrome c oxidase subunit III [Cryptosporidium ryanae]|uniref:cytochrome c oxidase subunit III n=1 Tax=Cryptosporidium ryanae TaxID=515981 RepID=UPI003519E99B|nr:cytochrome c oxidase subunit III [Cryptosporidium ryanae]
MWLSTRVENVDTGIAAKQGPSLPIENMFNTFLRMGLLFEFLCYFGLTLISYNYTNNLTFNYHSLGEILVQGNAPKYISFCFFLGIIGSIYLMVFQLLLADDTCFARGYVTGSKIIKVATLLDFIGKTIGFVFTLQLGGTTDLETAFNMAVAQGGVEINFLTFGQMLCGIAFILFGLGFLLLELFQDEGVGSTYGYINFIVFSASGIAIIIHATTFKTTGVNIFALASFASASLWAVFFEPAINEFSPAFGETELTNDVETQVEKFTRTNQYYNVDDNYASFSQPYSSGYVNQ